MAHNRSNMHVPSSEAHRTVVVAGVALNQTPLDWRGNAARIVKGLREARRKGVGVVCFPELCITGYTAEDAFFFPGVHQQSLEVLAELLPETVGIVAAIGLPIAHEGLLYDGAAVLADGAILGITCKQVLAREGVHYEPRWFFPWPQGQVGEITAMGQTIPIGDLTYQIGNLHLGFEICEDAWAQQRPGARLAQRGVGLILNPSCSHFAFGKLRQRRQIVSEGSRRFHASYLYVNALGNESGRMIYDGGTLIAHAGNVIALGERFSFHDVLMTTATITCPVSVTESDSRSSIRTDFRILPAPQASSCVPLEGGQADSEQERFEDFTRAVCLGLFDYMRKSKSRGFVISLSGGADSSSAAVLVYFMLRFALKDLGWDGLRERLNYWPETQSVASFEALMKVMLTCVYQRTKNNSAKTLEAARRVAAGVSATFYECDIDEIVEQYVSLVESQVGRELSWEADALALQNIQARVRGPSVWLLANLKQALLLTTSNRSEAAVGYTTMDGDTCGGLSPLGGIDKAFLLHWLRWVAEQGPAGFSAVEEVKAVTELEPTAELRPQHERQTDEAELMPYEVLDKIERAAIRDRKMPIEVFETMLKECPSYEREQLRAWTEKFFVLWSRNQWKRERYAPSFHLDDENLDPKTWCRFPILSAGFVFELERLARC